MLQDQTYIVQHFIGLGPLCAYNKKYVSLIGVYRKIESLLVLERLSSLDKLLKKLQKYKMLLLYKVEI